MKLLFIIVCLSSVSCNINNECDLFYDTHNKDLSAIIDLEALIIEPNRNLITIELLNYEGTKFNVEGKLIDGKLSYYKCEKSFNILSTKFNFDYNKTDSMLLQIYKNFESLKVLALYCGGANTYYTFIVNNNHAMIFIPDQKRLTEIMKKQISMQKAKAIKIFNDNWFCYKLDKPFISY